MEAISHELVPKKKWQFERKLSTCTRSTSLGQIHSITMKFWTTVPVFLAFVCCCQALLEDMSEINDECDTGCSSILMVDVSALGKGLTKFDARLDCKAKCKEGVNQAGKTAICAPLCGIILTPLTTVIPGIVPPKVCSLCEGIPGAGVAKCSAQINEAVQMCEAACDSDCAVGTSVGYQVDVIESVELLFSGLCN